MIYIISIQRICEGVAIWASDFESLLPPVKWSCWKCSEDLQEPNEESESRWAGSPVSPPRLAEHSNRRHWNIASAEVNGTSYSDFAAHTWKSPDSPISQGYRRQTSWSQVKTSAPVQQEVSPIRTFERWTDYPHETAWEAGMDPGDLHQSFEE